VHRLAALTAWSVLGSAALAVACGPGAVVRAEDAPAKPAPVRLTIVHTNDLHAHLENFAAVSQIARDERARNPNTLFLDAGDCITGTPVSTVFQGLPIFEVMNAMRYDAGILGNHEWDHGWQKVHEFVAKAEHPLLCANAKDPSGRPFGDGPSKVFDVGGVKVGVIGLVTADVPTLTAKKASEGCTFEEPLDVARRLVPEMRKHADVVVLLTHCGVEVDAAVAGAVPGIDLVVGGHSHTKLEKELSIQGARVVQSWEHGKCVGVIDLTWDAAAKRIGDFRSRLVAVQGRDLPRDPAVQKVVDGWMEKVAPMEEVIGKAPTDLSKRQLRPLIERIYREAAGADFGYQNAGGIRSELKAGDITVADVVTILPFDNTIVKLRLRGKQVPEFNRRELGEKFDPGRDYVFATNSYVADQREKYFGAKDAPVEDTKLLMRDVVIDWVRRHGGFAAGNEPAPPADDRTDPR
jgi:2',3'-cyclic-nucleotide 2'-phosphodiesterase (5'-nucleotidase family)